MPKYRATIYVNGVNGETPSAARATLVQPVAVAKQARPMAKAAASDLNGLIANSRANAVPVYCSATYSGIAAARRLHLYAI